MASVLLQGGTVATIYDVAKEAPVSAKRSWFQIRGVKRLMSVIEGGETFDKALVGLSVFVFWRDSAPSLAR